MWIIPKNYQPSSAFAADTLESSEDLTLPGLNIESSLMWRSKPSLLRTWSRRWKRESWLRQLFGQTLKPSQRTYFEAQLTLSLAATLANRSARQVSEQGQTIQDTCGPLSESTSKQLDLLDVFSRTSKATSRLDSAASLATWKKIVIEQRGEYSQRVKLARLIRESESTSWLTPRAMEVDESYETYQARMKASGNPKNMGKTRPACLTMQVKMQESKSWATPNTMDYLPQRSEEALIRQATTTRKGRTRPANLREQVNPTAVQIHQQATNWPTRTSRDHKGGYKEDALTRKDGKSRRFDALPNAAIGGVGTDVVRGHLNPDWVEWLMGVPTGWTALGCWGTE